MHVLVCVMLPSLAVYHTTCAAVQGRLGAIFIEEKRMNTIKSKKRAVSFSVKTHLHLSFSSFLGASHRLRQQNLDESDDGGKLPLKDIKKVGGETQPPRNFLGCGPTEHLCRSLATQARSLCVPTEGSFFCLSASCPSLLLTLLVLKTQLK